MSHYYDNSKELYQCKLKLEVTNLTDLIHCCCGGSRSSSRMCFDNVLEEFEHP